MIPVCGEGIPWLRLHVTCLIAALSAFIHCTLEVVTCQAGVAHQGKAMTSAELFDALWACRVFFQGPLVVQAGADSGVFLPVPRIAYVDLLTNYDVPPTACSCHLHCHGWYLLCNYVACDACQTLRGRQLLIRLSILGCKQMLRALI